MISLYYCVCVLLSTSFVVRTKKILSFTTMARLILRARHPLAIARAIWLSARASAQDHCQDDIGSSTLLNHMQQQSSKIDIRGHVVEEKAVLVASL